MINYYKPFRKVINFCIYFFFIFSLISNLCVYSSSFTGTIKYVFLSITTIVYIVFVLLFKGKIKKLLNKLINKISLISEKKLLTIIIITSIILKIIYYIFFFFDSTLGGGDITIYNNIANSIVEYGFDSVKDYIYYLVGMATHLAIFKFLKIPVHVGIYIIFLIGTIFNFFSFKNIVGKEKAFLLIMLYLLMPSTSLLTFCATHELPNYMYFSIFLFIYNKLLLSKDKKKACLLGIALLVTFILNFTVSPSAKIWFIVLPLTIILSNTSKNKKIILIFIMAIVLLVSNLTTAKYEDNFESEANNIGQILIGVNIETNGRHSDGFVKEAAFDYLNRNGIEPSYENMVEGEIGALKERLIYLFTHPLAFINLLANKFYTAWSGDYYSIELGHAFGGITNDIIYYILLATSGLIWLVAISIGVVFYNKKEDERIDTSNYKLIVLGIMALLLVTEIMNKYSCYMTMFIYLVAFERADLKLED